MSSERVTVLRPLAAVFFCVASAEAALELSETKEGAFTNTTIANRFFSVTLTSHGGRIRSLAHQKAGKETVLWAPGEGGWLDDRGTRTMARYSCRQAHKDAAVLE